MGTSSQRGSAHVVVTLCLVIALLFALGWIFWQNFVHKESTKKDTDLIVVDKDKGTGKKSEAPKPDLVISQWNVGADYDKTTAGNLEYSIENLNGIQVARFTSDAINSEDVCTYGASGAIERYGEMDKVAPAVDAAPVAAKDFFDSDVTNWKKVGDYYYWYRSPQALCSDNRDAELAASSAVRQFVTDLVEVKE